MKYFFHILWLIVRRKRADQLENEFLGYESFSERNMPTCQGGSAADVLPYRKAA